MFLVVHDAYSSDCESITNQSSNLLARAYCKDYARFLAFALYLFVNALWYCDCVFIINEFYSFSSSLTRRDNLQRNKEKDSRSHILEVAHPARNKVVIQTPLEVRLHVWFIQTGLDRESFINLSWFLRKNSNMITMWGFHFFSLSGNWLLLGSTSFSVNNY